MLLFLSLCSCHPSKTCQCRRCIGDVINSVGINYSDTFLFAQEPTLIWKWGKKAQSFYGIPIRGVVSLSHTHTYTYPQTYTYSIKTCITYTYTHEICEAQRHTHTHTYKFITGKRSLISLDESSAWLGAECILGSCSRFKH